MKQLYLTFLILTAILSAPFRATAYDFEVDGMYFNIVSLTEKTCELTQGEVKYSGDIKIPESVTYNNRILKVIRITKYTFYESNNLSTVTIPNSITEIGELAFSGCSHLSAVSLPNSITRIDKRAFHGCVNLSAITIPNSVTSIGDYAFSYCKLLPEVTIPNSVTSIGVGAFECCDNLTAVIIPNSITSISGGIFFDCKRLSEVTIPNSVTSIGESAFAYCERLSEVNIPNYVTSIGNSAFAHCKSLPEVTIPNYVTSIGERAFEECSSLTTVTIPNSVTSIGGHAFLGCTNLMTLIIEPSIEPLFFMFEFYMSYDNYFYETFKDSQIIHLTIGRDLVLSRDNNFNLLTVGLNKISNLTILDNIGKIDFLFSDKDFLPETLSELTIGENNTDYPASLSSYTSLKTMILKDKTPQRCPEFTNLQFENIKVYVPEGSLSSYQNADGWKNFWNLSDSDESGINEIISDAIKTEVARYDLQGRQVSADYRGLIIVCYSDGSVEKVINQ